MKARIRIPRIRVRRKRLLLAFLTFLAVACFFLVREIISELNGFVISSSSHPEAEEFNNQMDSDLKKMWLANKEINSDYVGRIVYDSGLLDLDFVQAKDVYREDGSLYVFYDEKGNLISDPEGHNGNDVYIWTSWKTGEYDADDEGGSVFMDYRNSLSDQNLIIYGHHFARDYDPEGNRQFTPLDLLLSQENYEDNRYLKLILDSEIRSYEVSSVFVISVLDDYAVQIIRTDMNRDFSGNADPDFFKGYIKYMNTVSEYETGVLLSEDDRILTLVTCLQHQPEYRQIVVCRQIEDLIFDG